MATRNPGGEKRACSQDLKRQFVFASRTKDKAEEGLLAVYIQLSNYFL